MTPDPLAARVQADHLMTQKIELGLRCGQILGPDYDGVPFEDVCRELVQWRAAAARVHALIAQWRETAACEREADVYDICVEALEAALAAATPLEHEQQAERILQLEAALSEAKVDHTRAILRYTAKGYAAGENADSKAWRQRAEAAEAALAAAPLDPWTIRALRLFSNRVSAIPRYNCDCLPNGPDGKTMATDEQHAQDVDIFACERWVVLWEDVQSVLGIAQTVIDRADDDLFLMTGRAERAEAALAAALAPTSEKEQ